MALSKKSKIIIIACVCAAVLVAVAVVLAVLLSGKKNIDTPVPAFERPEYVIKNGDTVTAPGAQSYKLLGNAGSGISVSGDGKFTVTQAASDGQQVLLGACINGKVVATAVCTVSAPPPAPTLVFENLSAYVIDGERIGVSASPVCSVSYALKTSVDGISIDPVTGAVAFSGAVADGAEFTVVAEARGSKQEKTFKASTGSHVTALNTTVICEYGIGGAAEFELDFGGDTETAAEGVLGVSVRGALLRSNEWRFDTNTHKLKINNSVLKQLLMGENAVSIFTARNTVFVTIKSARYIRTAEELAAINTSQKTLAEYYVMVCDVDLGDYLENSTMGWYPIGIYKEGANQPTESSFNGTFDGNGHTISGFWAARTDDFGYNSGLFGYVTVNAQIMNVRLVGDPVKPYNVKSFSGTLVGANCGIINNCVTDVNVKQGEGSQMAGAFVGRNEGTITDCYCIGNIDAGYVHGAFCGDNSRGAIINCYAVNADPAIPFVGTVSNEIVNSKSFDTNAALIAGAQFTGGWILSDDELPTLPSITVNFKITAVTITNTEASVVIGDTLKLKVSGLPEDIFSYDKLEFCVIEGDGVMINPDGTVLTAGAEEGECTVEVRADGASASYTFTLVKSGDGA